MSTASAGNEMRRRPSPGQWRLRVAGRGCRLLLFLPLWLADHIMLWSVYGGQRVEQEHLQIVRMKPIVLISNGDHLDQWAFPHFLIGMAIWLPLCIGVLVALRWPLRRDCRSMSQISADNVSGWPAGLVLPTALLSICCDVMPIVYAFAIVFAIAVAWRTVKRSGGPTAS